MIIGGFQSVEAAKRRMRWMVAKAKEKGFECGAFIRSENDGTWTIVEGDDMRNLRDRAAGCGTFGDPGFFCDSDAFGFWAYTMKLREDLGL